MTVATDGGAAVRLAARRPRSALLLLVTVASAAAGPWDAAAAVDAAVVAAPAADEAASASTRDDGARRLREYLADTRTLRAEFQQSLLAGTGELLESSSGALMIRRPGRFRWDYREPYEQQIVADGRRLWLYDPDLEQVTVRPQAASLENTPASLLSGDADFTRHYRVTDARSLEDGTFAVRLEPLADSGDFRFLVIAFDARGELMRMELMDRLDQRTRIEFSAVERGVRLRRSLFEFTPPDGVDVIESGPASGTPAPASGD